MTPTLPKSRGFTLIEIAIASTLVGILLLIIVPQAYDSQTAARATQIERIASSVAVSWGQLTRDTGLPTTVSNNVVAATPSATGVAEVLFVGQSRVATAYQSSFSALGIKPLNQLVDNPTGTQFRTAGSLDIYVSLSGGGAAPLAIQFQNVSTPVVRALVQRVRADATVANDTSTYTVGPWAYTCSANRTCTVTYSKAI